MPSSAVRKSILTIVAILLAVGAIVFALPLIASTQLVRDRIVWEMRAWSGLDVAVGEGPQIEVWPSFRAILRNVSMAEGGGGAQPAVIRAERVEIDLSAMAALRGDVGFSRVRLVRPVLRLGLRGDGPALEAPSDGGRVVRAVETTREAVEANPAEVDAGNLPSDPLGTVEFTDGRVVISEAGAEREILTSVDGSLSWPALDQPAQVTATAIWRGEGMSLNFSSPQPLVLLAGGNAPLKFSLEAAPLSGAYEGMANLSSAGYLDGNIMLSTPSLRRALEWSRTDIAPGAAVGAVSLAAHVSGADGRFKFQQAELSLAGNPGTGLLDVSFANGVPAVAGTLAFERLDLNSFMAAFTSAADGQEPGVIDTSFTEQVNLDLRLSAATANAGAIEMTDVAATAQVKSGLAAFDISDATAFSGMIQAGVRIDQVDGHNQAEVRVLASEIDSAALAAAAGFGRFSPQGTATVSVILKGPVKGWDTLIDRADGSISARLGAGTIAGLDLQAFLARAKQGGFFALSEVAEGELPVESAEFKAALSNGVARIEQADATSSGQKISLSGIVPYIGRGLALSGTVSPVAGEPEEATLSFFVGGPWNAPFISPIGPRAPGAR